MVLLRHCYTSFFTSPEKNLITHCIIEYCACMRNACATSTFFLFRFLAFFGGKWPDVFGLFCPLKAFWAPKILLYDFRKWVLSAS